MLTKRLEHLFYMLQVLCPSVAKDKNIIKQYKYKLADDRLEDVIHQRLEC
jgi:hypothetical protein